MIMLSQTVSLVLLAFVSSAERNDPCTTPNEEAAKCTPLSSCSVIQDGISTLNNSAVEFARLSTCGFDTERLVCCGSTGQPLWTSDPPESELLPSRNVCGFGLTDTRIYGGEVTEIGEFPWMALLGYKKEDNSSAGFRCGGSLINNRYVLTAAHCVKVKEMGLRLDMIRLGEWKISSAIDCEEELTNQCADPVLDVKSEKEIAHPNYGRRSGNNDIALVRLDRNVEYTDFILPICLPSFYDPKPREKTQLVVSGWGATENGSSSDVKLKLKVPVVQNSDCLVRIKSRGTVSENQICAGGEKGKDACQGDSGGPLMRLYEDMRLRQNQWYQEGVVAWGIGCGLKGVPAVYTRVAKYLDWILNNMSEF